MLETPIMRLKQEPAGFLDYTNYMGLLWLCLINLLIY